MTTKIKTEKEIRQKLDYLIKLQTRLKTKTAQYALKALIENYRWILGENPDMDRRTSEVKK